ncbi:hypothetical protein FZW96_21075 [Bacillus sp. BGMRC 2118]|nr:hypothetical protein FZW96_21075 [Bacillus sp. BGMRC 2118]
MNIKRLAIYICYVIILFSILTIGLKHQAALYNAGKTNYEVIPYYQFCAIFPIIIGVCLSIPQHIKNFSQNGKWKIDWIKLLVIGLPFLILSVIPILYLYEVIGFRIPFSAYIMGGNFGIGASDTFTTIIGLISGYVVSTSIIKDNN